MKENYFNKSLVVTLFLFTAVGLSLRWAKAQTFEFTTDKAVGDKITLKLGGGNASVEGLSGVSSIQGDYSKQEYTLGAKTVKLTFASQEDVPTEIDVAGNAITTLSFKNQGMACLNISCDCNKISGENMDAFLQGLPYKSGVKLFVIADYAGANEENICLKSSIKSVEARGYMILKRTSAEDAAGTAYAGSETANEEFVKITTKVNPQEVAEFSIWGDGYPDAIKPGTTLSIALNFSVQQYSRRYVLQSLKAGDKELEFTEQYGTYKATYTVQQSTELVATYYVPKGDLNVSVSPEEGGTLKVQIDGVESTGEALKGIEKGKLILLTCLSQGNYSIDKLLVDGRDTYTSDDYPTSEFSAEGKDMNVQLSFKAPCAIAVNTDENIASWEVLMYNKSEWTYVKMEQSALANIKANKKLLFKFTPKEGYKIDKVVAIASDNTEKEIPYIKDEKGYKFLTEGDATIKVISKKNLLP